MTSTETIIHITSKNEKSPGPQEYVPQTMFGNSAPKYTIARRIEDKPDKNMSPELHMLKSTVGDGPKYSFQGRPKTPKKDNSPGPNYMPPAFGSDSQKSTFHGYVKEKPIGSDAPGPGQYAVPSTIGQGKKFSMKGRIYPPDGPESSSPGPSMYSPNYEAAMPGIRHTHIGSRPQDRKPKDPGPGPGEYVIPSTLKKNAPCFHERIPEHRTFSGPGPAAYETSVPIGSDARKFTMRPRIEIKNKVKGVPYYAYKSSFGEGPKPSFHGRPQEKKAEATPGPSYMPPPFGSDTKKFSFGNRRDVSKRATSAQTPGPGAYQVPSSFGNGRKFTMKGRDFPPEKLNDNPGPAQYAPDYQKLMGGRKTEIGKRLPDKKPTSMGQYYVLPDPDRGPAFTIGRRDNLEIQAGKV